MSVWVTTPAYAAATRRKLAELDATVPADARAALAWAANAGFHRQGRPGLDRGNSALPRGLRGGVVHGAAEQTGVS